MTGPPFWGGGEDPKGLSKGHLAQGLALGMCSVNSWCHDYSRHRYLSGLPRDRCLSLTLRPHPPILADAQGKLSAPGHSTKCPPGSFVYHQSVMFVPKSVLGPLGPTSETISLNRQSSSSQLCCFRLLCTLKNDGRSQRESGDVVSVHPYSPHWTWRRMHL